jgi:hypothetical protein
MKMRAAPLELKPYRCFTSMVIPVSNRPLNANADNASKESENHCYHYC